VGRREPRPETHRQEILRLETRPRSRDER